jgi:signal transduction histidine kinase
LTIAHRLDGKMGAMRRRMLSVLSRRTWWWVFSLLIALPAVTLMALGLRAMRMDDLEQRAQDRRDVEQTTRLIDTALTAAFDRLLEEEAVAVRDDRAADECMAFEIDARGVLAVPAARLFTGPFGELPAVAGIAPSIELLSDTARRAQAAHAQHRLAHAAALYRDARHDPSVQRWADLQHAIVRLQMGDLSALPAVVDPGWAESDARSPEGIPLAMLASSAHDAVAPSLRSRFVPLLTATLQAIRQGRWWLDVDASRAYERELIAWTPAPAPAIQPPSVTRFAEVMKRLQFRLAQPQEQARAVFMRDAPVSSLIIWTRPGNQGSSRSGVLLTGAAIESLFATSIAGLLGDGRVGAVVADADGHRVWASGSDAPAEFQRLESIAGLQLGLGGPTLTADAVRWRRTRNYALIIVPVVVLACGLIMTVWIARRELALVRQQSAFVAAVTHEFKSPLTGIRLLMERLTRTRPAGEASGKYYAAIDAETARLEGLVDRLLEVQKLQAGQREFTFGLSSVHDVAATVVERMAPHAEARGIRLRFEAAPNLPPVSIDRDAIADALGNLIDNAIKYSPAGTAVTVHLQADAGDVMVQVIDEGVGVDPAEATRIFEPFYRSPRGDRANVQGTGLGLALVKAAADAHGGTVTVASTGTGSCFTMRFPTASAEQG